MEQLDSMFGSFSCYMVFIPPPKELQTSTIDTTAQNEDKPTTLVYRRQPADSYIFDPSDEEEGLPYIVPQSEDRNLSPCASSNEPDNVPPLPNEKLLAPLSQMKLVKPKELSGSLPREFSQLDRTLPEADDKILQQLKSLPVNITMHMFSPLVEQDSGMVDFVLICTQTIKKANFKLLEMAITYGPLVINNHARFSYLATPIVFRDFSAIVGSPYFLGVVPAHQREGAAQKSPSNKSTKKIGRSRANIKARPATINGGTQMPSKDDAAKGAKPHPTQIRTYSSHVLGAIQDAAIQRHMIQTIIEDIFAQQGEVIQVANLYSVPYPIHHQLKKLLVACLKVPKLQKFDGHGSPLEHVAHYTTAMGDLAFDESYLLRYFTTSLTGVAFQWYSKLKSNSVADWADMQKKFINHFQTAERKVSLAELCSLKQKKRESAIDFIKRWREFSMKCDNPPVQEDAITICRRGLITAINEKLLGANTKSFDQLNSIVAEIEMFLAKQMAHTSHKGKFPKERNPPGKEVNVIDFSPGNEAKGAIISPPPKKKLEPKVPVPTLAERMKAPYSFKKEHTKKLFDLSLDN
ncbi:hypothetical protein Taro_050385 [Colocasia esculenta]|uniref:Retrotransposon gag domain-containing protein n=1 Tax=Colocasia esculenta TaxID=4460 RepID=A0A843XDA1_COLES|nr:hypothetical protein [Colocasia esculenta]